MKIRAIGAILRACFKQWFHQRNLIIVSEHKVRHVPVSGAMQFVALLLLAGSICWASYSTGSYLAARTTLKSQSQALRSIASSRVDSSLGLPYPSSDENVLNMDKEKLAARVVLLEQKVVELKSANDGIIQRVREKTSGQLDELEAIIKQTGLNPGKMKKEARTSTGGKAEGGPYIPADAAEASGPEAKLYRELDELAALRRVVGNLPLAEPIKNADEQSSFGNRIDPFNGHLAFHSGLDIAGPAGASIHSTADGTVTFAGNDNAYGNVVDISHGFGVVTRYAHLSEILVQDGQRVKKGQRVGIQGSTGRSTGNHLHYEVRYRNQALNPKNFLKAGQHVAAQE